VLIADVGYDRAPRVSSASGRISTGAGTFGGDGGPATAAALFQPSGVAVAANGDLVIADTFNSVRRVSSDSGRISTVAGTGAGTFSAAVPPPRPRSRRRTAWRWPRTATW
jgi:hypothetical protein